MKRTLPPDTRQTCPRGLVPQDRCQLSSRSSRSAATARMKTATYQTLILGLYKDQGTKGLRLASHFLLYTHIYTHTLIHSLSSTFHLLLKTPSHSYAGGTAGPRPPSGIVLQSPSSSYTTSRRCSREEGGGSGVVERYHLALEGGDHVPLILWSRSHRILLHQRFPSKPVSSLHKTRYTLPC